MPHVSSAESHPAPLAWEQKGRPLILIAFIALALFTLRLAGPPNLLDQDQERPAAYVLDVVKNGQWICQRDLAGDISSKPPLYTWLASLVTLATGRLSLFSLYLPGALGLFGIAYLVFIYGRSHFGARAGLLGALACLLCPAGLKALGLARTDGVFAFLVTAGAFLAYRAWMQGRGWTWFWLVAAAGTLTKGPLALVLSSAGLLAGFWERRTGETLPMRGSQAAGVACYVLLTAGWLGLAVWDLGKAVTDKMLLQELVHHATEGEKKLWPGAQLYLSPLYYLARSAPWSVFGYYGLWRIYRAPALDGQERRFERFLFCWFAGGLLLFSLAPHQRGDLLWPIMPAAALMAGRELSRFTARLRTPHAASIVYGMMALGLIGFTVYFLGPRRQHRMARQTIAVRDLAREIERVGGEEFPLTHVDGPTGLQAYLNTYRPPVTLERAAALLRGKEAAFVAVNNLKRLESVRQSNDPPFHVLLKTEGPVKELDVQVVGNRPELRLYDAMGVALGPWLVRYNGRLIHASSDRFEFAAGSAGGRVSVSNQSATPQALHLRMAGAQKTRSVEQLIAPTEIFTTIVAP